jgi:magnesium transporter
MSRSDTTPAAPVPTVAPSAAPTTTQPDHLNLPISTVIREDVATLRESATIQQALDDIRLGGIGEKVVYFYVVDGDGALVGVVPTRRLLTAPLHQRLSEVMIKRIVAIPQTATVLDACELFVFHKFLALPVVDEERRLLGVVDVSIFTDEVLNLAERQRTEEVFEAIGFRISQVQNASSFRAFRFRFPWLLATIGSGTLCALLASSFEATLAQSILLAFFLTLVLGLGESVSMQSMTMTILDLRLTRPTLRWYVRALWKEMRTALLLGGACGLLVALIAWLCFGAGLEAVVIGSSILLALCAACLLGLSIPAILHGLRLDPKIAAGPATLAAADLFTLLFYLTLAWLLL